MEGAEITKVKHVVRGPRFNRRVTYTIPNNARSESAIAVNPLNPYNMVAGSKLFTNPKKYEFSLAIYSTLDGGETWAESSPLALLPGWAGTSDPALAWDNKSNAYLVALPFTSGANPKLIGMAVYKSSDGGRTWGKPQLIHASEDPGGDDKQWTIGDGNPNSPYYGNVYSAWDGGGIGRAKLRFARTTDHGATWKGIKVGGVDQPAGTALQGINDSGSPEFAIAADGTLYIVWTSANDTIKFIKSIDGGDSFSQPKSVATGITSFDSLPANGFHHFPGATFRVESFATICSASGNNVLVAWPDLREGFSHVYYRRSTDGGNTWLGPEAGEPMMSEDIAPRKNQHDFHPQLICTPSGEIGCAFYEFGPKGQKNSSPLLIDVILALSVDDGQSFSERVLVTDYPWNPAVNAPWSHGDPNVTFIGDYFGLDASSLGFFPLWTDTRTGVQEIFTARINEI
jgi:hypothetical protein